MEESFHKNQRSYFISIAVATFATVMLVFFSSCSEKKAQGLDPVNTSLVPTIQTEDVVSLISDSGITRYKFQAKEWLMFSKAQSPYWHFPKGIYVEKFDSVFDVDASIEADTAYFWEQKKLWELKGNVKIQNIQNERFETQLLFWDQNAQKIYSDSAIRIERAGGNVIYGKGFVSNEQMTKWDILQTSADLYIKEDSTKTDSTKIKTDSIPKTTHKIKE